MLSISTANQTSKHCTGQARGQVAAGPGQAGTSRAAWTAGRSQLGSAASPEGAHPSAPHRTAERSAVLWPRHQPGGTGGGRGESGGGGGRAADLVVELGPHAVDRDDPSLDGRARKSLDRHLDRSRGRRRRQVEPALDGAKPALRGVMCRHASVGRWRRGPLRGGASLSRTTAVFDSCWRASRGGAVVRAAHTQFALLRYLKVPLREVLKYY